MVNFSMDLNQLIKAARAWDHASDTLTVAATQAQSIHFSHQDVVWGLFQDAWDAQAAAARYMYDRMVEGRNETDSIAKVLDHVAKVHQEQDQNFANVLIKLEDDYQ
ncbi:hypothetical protein ACFQZZ_11070 [Nocardia sp. GCM10030253]|uniref:hypothetical protein n=1 Tax=Nocardia sp. GCM10030253 TaxID=3273404 RepID=UPI003632CA40